MSSLASTILSSTRVAVTLDPEAVKLTSVSLSRLGLETAVPSTDTEPPEPVAGVAHVSWSVASAYCRNWPAVGVLLMSSLTSAILSSTIVEVTLPLLAAETSISALLTKLILLTGVPPTLGSSSPTSTGLSWLAMV